MPLFRKDEGTPEAGVMNFVQEMAQINRQLFKSLSGFFYQCVKALNGLLKVNSIAIDLNSGLGIVRFCFEPFGLLEEMKNAIDSIPGVRALGILGAFHDPDKSILFV
ncbi:MAG: hypothetical protein Q9228_003025 [Teloschistes exilis]